MGKEITYTLHFQDKETGLGITLQADSFEKIQDAMQRHYEKNLNPEPPLRDTNTYLVDGRPKNVLTK